MAVGKTQFQTNKRIYNLSDAPGHQNYASLMINATITSNFAIIIVSAEKNEFAAGISINIKENAEGSTR